MKVKRRIYDNANMKFVLMYIKTTTKIQRNAQNSINNTNIFLI